MYILTLGSIYYCTRHTLLPFYAAPLPIPIHHKRAGRNQTIKEM